MGILTGLVDRAVLVAAFIGGATVPSFVAQYRQRVGGALEQAKRDLAPFQDIADRMFKGDIRALIDHHWQSTDPVFRAESQAISNLVDSVNRLTQASTALQDDLYHQLAYLARSADIGMLRATWSQFEPAVSFAPQTLLAGVCIGAAVWLVFFVLMHAVLALTRRSLPPLQFWPKAKPKIESPADAKPSGGRGRSRAAG
ncbi:DUF2937 family protein [Ramlibacter tataouinensis]|uniref:Uncharacterized protein n=1 Tax=Ramlibacter tataouinensis (strain ATCC BAA-407 / DSM 14655 / LMG 21543 / TTB310) TaxID=365046 RepID=F5Y0K2_RAMTT|nr:DUF2937 family protein [Ramlibacter tataouinensis]AEG93408.1 Conserved hypothetical protein [Ramlibacter tataouinensis TTB310]